MFNVKIVRIIILSALLCFRWLSPCSAANENPVIIPVPLEVRMMQGSFIIDKSTFIVLPEFPGKSDTFYAGLLLSEFSDKYGHPIMMRRVSALSEDVKSIIIGDILNPLVKKYCMDQDLMGTLGRLGEEGYILSVSGNKVVVAANTKDGALYGLQSLRQLIKNEEGVLSLPRLFIEDKPVYPFRGIKLYLPGRENLTFFKRFIKDFAAFYKFNKIILELNANMRLESHPELNAGAVRFAGLLSSGRLDRPPGRNMEYQNSSHQDNADGGILEKEEVADLVEYIRKFNIEVIPELPSLTHSYYLLHDHEELAENLNQPYPDTYCPLKSGSYEIYFDVLNEYIELIRPAIVHIGHDEWRMEKDICDLCRGKDYGQLFADDVTRIHDFLSNKGIKTAMWGDHLLESVTGKEFRIWKSSTGYEYKIPGALKPEQVLKSIPRDILIFNWFWDDINNDKQLSDFGFEQVFGNFRPDIDKWDERLKIKGIIGGAPSSWAATTEFNLAKDQLLDFIGSVNILWSQHYLPADKLALITQSLVRDIHYRFSGKKLPSDTGSRVIPKNISAHYNTDLAELTGNSGSDLLKGKIKSGNAIFNLGSPSSTGQGSGAIISRQKVPVYRIEINEDVNSIIFLHACDKEAVNRKAYTVIHNFDETAELLGWYEIVFEDGFIETVPIRYGINILDWKWRRRINASEAPKARNSQNKYACNASAVLCSTVVSEPVTFFSYEWENVRLGNKITEINLKTVNYTEDNDNAIILLAISVAENSKTELAKGTERE